MKNINIAATDLKIPEFLQRYQITGQLIKQDPQGGSILTVHPFTPSPLPLKYPHEPSVVTGHALPAEYLLIQPFQPYSTFSTHIHNLKLYVFSALFGIIIKN